MSLYADDPQVHVDYAITDRDGEAVDFTPTVTTGATVLTAAWVGGPGIQRTLRVELAGLTAGSYRLRLGNPDGNDVELGSVTLY